MVKSMRLIALFFLFLSASANAEQVVLKWGFTEYHPYLYQTANGDMRGTWAKKIEKIAEKADLILDPVKFPISKMKQRFNDDSVDFYTGIKKLVEGSDEFLFSAKPILHVELVAYSHGRENKIESIRDLLGKSVIVVKGLTYNGLRDWMNKSEEIKIAHEIVSYEDAFKKLKKLKNGVFLGYKAPATTALRFASAYVKKSLNQTTFERFDRYIIIRKSHPQAQVVIDRLDAAMR